jgi:hypothetical protein
LLLHQGTVKDFTMKDASLRVSPVVGSMIHFTRLNWRASEGVEGEGGIRDLLSKDVSLVAQMFLSF